MAVNYYSRMRFTMNLVPELSAAGKNKQLSRVLTVLAAGSEADIDMDNMDVVFEGDELSLNSNASRDRAATSLNSSSDGGEVVRKSEM